VIMEPDLGSHGDLGPMEDDAQGKKAPAGNHDPGATADTLGSGETRPADRNPLRVHMQEAEEAKRLATRLVGLRLPDVTLTTSQSMRLPLLSHVSGRVAIYFVPGDKEGPYEDGRPTPDSAQHRGFVNRLGSFNTMGVTIMCVSGQPLSAVQRIGHYFDFSHFMFSDPEFLVAEALGLPTSQKGDARYYRRITLVTNGGQIERVFFPIADGDAAGNARQIKAWMQAAGWDQSCSA
jgi:peroxiredoxin